MKNLIDHVFTKRKLIILIFLFFFIYGIYSYIVIPKQDMPSIKTPYMVLTVVAPGLDASNIDRAIVDDMESLILTFREVSTVRSTIYDNYAIIVLEYYYSIDNPDKTSLEIFLEIGELDLSDKITSLSYSSNFDEPHIIYAINSDLLSNQDLLNHSYDFKNELLSVNEIKKVNIDSSLETEVNIELNTEVMNLYGLSITDVYQILYANSLNIPLGGLDTSTGTVSINGNLIISDISTLEDMIIIPEIPTISPTVYLKDISSISLEDSSEKIYEFNDNNTTFLSVYFEEDVDFTKMGGEITALKDKYLEENDDSDLSIGEMLFLPDYVNKQINNVFYSLLVSILVVMVVVFIGIGFRNSILIIITIPLIVFSTILVLYTFGYELHQLTIVGLIISIGILVDNSIVITEGIKRNIDTGLDKIISAKKAIIDNAIPVLTSTLTTIVAFVVLVLLPGFLGNIVSSMPVTVIVALSISYIVSIFLSPILATIFMKRSNSLEFKPPSVHEKNIKTMIRFTLKYPLVWILISTLVLVSSVYFAFDRQNIDLYPNDGKSVLYIDIENETLDDLESTRNILDSVKDVFKNNSGVVNYSSSVGGDLPKFHFSTSLLNERKHIGRININLNLNENDLEKYKKSLENNLKAISGAKISVNNIELSPPTTPLVVTLLNDSSEQLDLTSDNVFSKIVALDNVKTYTITKNNKSPKYIITYDYDRISNEFLSKAQIDQLITMNVNGVSLLIYNYEDKIIDVNLLSDINVIEEILTLKIYSEMKGEYFFLDEFIEIEIIEDYNVIIKHNNVNASYIELDYNDDSSLSELETRVGLILDDNIDNSTTAITSGENTMFEEIKTDLIRASIFAIILIYIIMLSQFNNLIKPLIILLTIPLSFSGSFILLILLDGPITATFLIGMVSLIGVTVNTGIILIEYISRIHKKNDNILEACVEAVYIRFRPIILTSFTTILGIIPLLVSGGSFFKPLAISFMGGMISSTFFTIFIIPSVYFLIYKKSKKRRLVKNN